MRTQLKTFCFIGFILCMAFLVFADDGNENATKWSGNVGVGLSFSSGNTHTSNVSITFSAKKPLSSKVEFSNSGFFLLSRIDGATTTETLGFSSRINWQHSDRFFSFYEIQGVRDKFKNYSYRLYPAVGVGYKVVSSDKGELSFSAGVAEVMTKYLDTGKTDSFAGLTFGDQLTWKISSSADLKQLLVITSDVSELSHYFAHLEVSLSASMAKNWAIMLSFIDNYDNNPVGEGIEKNDVLFLAGVTLKF